jgi:hypothetical protein
MRNRELNMKYFLLKELKNKAANKGGQADRTQINLEE